MNAATRKVIDELLEKLGEIKDEVENLQSEEQDKFDNMSEGLQQSERGQLIEEAASDLDSAIYALDEVCDYLTSAQEH